MKSLLNFHNLMASFLIQHSICSRMHNDRLKAKDMGCFCMRDIWVHRVCQSQFMCTVRFGSARIFIGSKHFNGKKREGNKSRDSKDNTPIIRLKCWNTDIDTRWNDNKMWKGERKRENQPETKVQPQHRVQQI